MFFTDVIPARSSSSVNPNTTSLPPHCSFFNYCVFLFSTVAPKRGSMNARCKELDNHRDRDVDGEREADRDREEREGIDEEMVTVYVADAALDLGGLKQVRRLE